MLELRKSTVPPPHKGLKVKTTPGPVATNPRAKACENLLAREASICCRKSKKTNPSLLKPKQSFWYSAGCNKNICTILE